MPSVDGGRVGRRDRSQRRLGKPWARAIVTPSVCLRGAGYGISHLYASRVTTRQAPIASATAIQSAIVIQACDELTWCSL